MSNIIDYLKWRGDLKLSIDAFNEIDSLILSRFSYFPFDTLIKENEEITIEELSNRFEQEEGKNLKILWPEDKELFLLMGISNRFKEMRASRYINDINAKQEQQFSCITIQIPDDTIFISFRGTDNTIVGWKEDFNMSFKSHIPAQKKAVEYVEQIAQKYPDKLIRIGGHSKGGNLAIYSAVFASENVKNRIINVYNNDGPGFSEEITETQEYKDMINKVKTYIPQDSVVGRLLNHEESYKVIKSTQKGLMQHDVYSWQLVGKEFELLREVTNGSAFVDKSITDWLERIDAKQREQVIDIVFELINKTQARTLTELKAGWIENSKIIFESYRAIDKEDRKMITATFAELFRIMKDNFLEEYKQVNNKEEINQNG